jgi:bacillopeptidase F
VSKYFWVWCLFLGLSAWGLEGSENSRIASDLQSVLERSIPNDSVAVIAYLADGQQKSLVRQFHGRSQRRDLIRNLRQNANRVQKNFLRELHRVQVTDIHSFWTINAISFKAPKREIEKLSNFPQVQAFRLDQIIRLSELLYTAESTPEWNLSAIHAPEMWDAGFTGQRVVVATMDTGADGNHLALASTWRGGTNSWLDPYGQYPDFPYDGHGHGTAVMGILSGGINKGFAIGVAPGARWIAVKIFDDANNATFSKIHLGFQWLLDPDGDPNTDDAPDIVNNSWGLHDQVNQCILEFSEDIDLLNSAGIVVIFAAGNEGPQAATSISPANNPGSFSVGSVASSQVIYLSSSRGPSPCLEQIFPDVVAPGVNILTADLTSGGAFPNASTYLTGTSAASPHAAGALALLLSALPDIETDILQTVLRESAQDLGIPEPDDIYGWGLIDVWAAFQELLYRISNGDLNGSGWVDMEDVMIFLGSWLEPCPQENICIADINQDGFVNLADFAVLKTHFGLMISSL